MALNQEVTSAEAVGGKVLSPAWLPVEERLPLPFISRKAQEKPQYQKQTLLSLELIQDYAQRGLSFT